MSEPRTLPISVKIQVGDWGVEEQTTLTLEQRANMGDDLFTDLVKRMLDSLFTTFQRRF